MIRSHFGSSLWIECWYAPDPTRSNTFSLVRELRNESQTIQRLRRGKEDVEMMEDITIASRDHDETPQREPTMIQG